MGFEPMDMEGIKSLDNVDTHINDEAEAERQRKITWAKTELQMMLAKDIEFMKSIGYDEEADEIKGDDGRAFYLVLHLSKQLGNFLESSPEIINGLYLYAHAGAAFDFEKLKTNLRSLVTLH